MANIYSLNTSTLDYLEIGYHRHQCAQGGAFKPDLFFPRNQMTWGRRNVGKCFNHVDFHEGGVREELSKISATLSRGELTFT